MHDTFDMVYANSMALFIISRVYMYTFVALFIYAILNIFIMITEDAFFMVKDSLQANEVSSSITSIHSPFVSLTCNNISRQMPRSTLTLAMLQNIHTYQTMMKKKKKMLIIIPNWKSTILLHNVMARVGSWAVRQP